MTTERIDAIWGIHAVREAIESGRAIQHIHIQQELWNPRLRELMEYCRSRNIPLRFDPGPSIDRLAQGGHHQGVVAVTAGHSYASLDEVLDRISGENLPAGSVGLSDRAENALVLLLDGVQDTHNLGALIRTACAAGAQAVVLPERRSAGLSPAVVQAASGAAEYVPVARVTNLAQTLEVLKQRSFWIFGLDEHGDKPYDQVDYHGFSALLVGGEGKGLHQLLKKKCDFLIRIPTPGKISTLNVSVAAGIVLFEAARQQRTAG